MLKFLLLCLLPLCILCSTHLQAQVKSSILIQSTFEDESIEVAVNKPVYFPGDTVRLTIQRTDSTKKAAVTPILPIEGAPLHEVGHLTYVAIIPQTVTPGVYHVGLRVLDPQGRRFSYKTDCAIEIEEYQDIEQLRNYVRIGPSTGSEDLQLATTLDRDQIRALKVLFLRDSIRSQMGPQFITIRTTAQSREGLPVQSLERRVVTFRSHGDPNRDRIVFNQYRTAYGPYAAIHMKELEQVQAQFDSLPDWAILKITIEPDYGIKIGTVDRSNSITRYFRVRGPTIEIGLSLGIPKVLYDTRPDDVIEYGSYSAIVRFYHVDQESGLRFPVSFGVGTFGVNSPIDVGIGRGGFVGSFFLDMIEMMRILDIGNFKKINLGLELTPFVPIKNRARVLINANVSLAL